LAALPGLLETVLTEEITGSTMTPRTRNRTTAFVKSFMVELLLHARMEPNKPFAWNSQKMFRKWNAGNEESAPWR
jgi:hypothetical protein